MKVVVHSRTRVKLREFSDGQALKEGESVVEEAEANRNPTPDDSEEARYVPDMLLDPVLDACKRVEADVLVPDSVKALARAIRTRESHYRRGRI